MSQLIRYGRHALAGFVPVPGATSAISYRGKSGFIDPDTALAFDFAATGDLIDEVNGLELNFARSSEGQYFDATGALVSAANNEPRFDHDPNTLAARGLLIEAEPRTNIFLNSDAPVTQGVTTAADTYSISVIGSGTVTMSGTGAGVASEGSPLTIVCSAGTLTCTVAGGPDWVQVELGGFASSMIKTAGAPVPRAADIPSTTDVSWNDVDLGTMYAKASALGTSPNGVMSGLSSSNANTIQMQMNNIRPAFNLTNSGGDNGSIAGTTIPANQITKFAVAYQLNDSEMAQDGVIQGQDTTILLPLNNAPTNLQFGARTGQSLPFFGHVHEWAYANVRKDAAFLQQLTTL